jgi:simple sugar transport system permease protein
LPLGAYLFGGVDAIGFRAQVFGIRTSVIVLRMLPYLSTLAVMLLIALGRRRLPMPSALGQPYSREE